ncbi:hypothetical protein M9H77_11540 [Catharanthus roseus]|uniref:Uncharacterized protein n=1 Tax=Catharanthus roseus TaxID=4058 RepID=A0ACC0BET6_CATRO|nr:hypothetical protein M9H77_11540 [Catharanthus roseus]
MFSSQVSLERSGVSRATEVLGQEFLNQISPNEKFFFILCKRTALAVGIRHGLFFCPLSSSRLSASAAPLQRSSVTLSLPSASVDRLLVPKGRERGSGVTPVTLSLLRLGSEGLRYLFTADTLTRSVKAIAARHFLSLGASIFPVAGIFHDGVPTSGIRAWFSHRRRQPRKNPDLR